MPAHKAPRAQRGARPVTADTPTGRHRAPARHRAESVGGTRTNGAVRTAVALSGLAAVATGISVAGGVIGTPAATPAAADIAGAASLAVNPEALEKRVEQPVVSRSDRRGSTDAAKVAALSVDQGHVVSHSERLSDGDPRDIARALLGEYGFDASQFSCLDSLYVSESNWRVDADNPTSSAYGIPQALTSTHDLPADYMTSAESQIRWGLDYIRSRYGTPCNAWSFKQGHNWY